MHSGWLLLNSTYALGAPLILAALGGFLSERCGIINIALEGTMLGSCFATAIVGVLTKNPAMGIAAGLATSVVLSLLHLTLTQEYRVDPTISGMGVNALAIGGANFLSQRLITPDMNDQVPELPVVWLRLLALLLPFALWAYVTRTRAGLAFWAVGNDPQKAREMGVSTQGVRWRALALSGVLTGLAGILIVGNAGRYSDNMTSGRGYIALAALILGGWRPVPCLAACLVFAGFDALQLNFQGTGFLSSVPAEYWNCLPFVATLIGLAGFVGRSRPPYGLGKL